MKKQKIKFGELRSLQTTIQQLESLLQGLRSGSLTLARGDEEISLRPGAAVHFELSAKTDGERERLALALDWRRKTLRAGTEPAPREPARALASGAENEDGPVTLRCSESAPSSETSAVRQGAPRAEELPAPEI